MLKNKELFYGILVAVVIVGISLFVFNRLAAFPAQGFIITTDKAEYKQGETVKITVTNNLDYIVTPIAVSPDFIDENGFIRKVMMKEYFLGENYGIGIISQKFKNKNDEWWTGIEPVWRCGNSCFGECLYKHSFEPGETRTFYWEQTYLICDKSSRTEKIEKAEPGRYRIMSSIGFDKEKGRYKVIYSNELTIK